jgi:hypothetical protein
MHVGDVTHNDGGLLLSAGAILGSKRKNGLCLHLGKRKMSSYDLSKWFQLHGSTLVAYSSTKICLIGIGSRAPSSTLHLYSNDTDRSKPIESQIIKRIISKNMTPVETAELQNQQQEGVKGILLIFIVFKDMDHAKDATLFELTEKFLNQIDDISFYIKMN